MNELIQLSETAGARSVELYESNKDSYQVIKYHIK